MSTPQTNQNQNFINVFPWKILLWALLIIFIVFMFRDPLIKLLSEAEEVTIWDKIKIKVSKADVKKLELAQADYQKRISVLNQQVDKQNETINHLNSIRAKLEEDVRNCPQAQESVKQFNNEFEKVKDINSNIRIQSEVLRESSLIRKARVR